MSNLGSYQVMTVIAKRVGGPWVLTTLVALGGWVVGRGAEAGGKVLWKRAKRRPASAQSSVGVFTVTTEADCGSGLTLRKGDEIRVLEGDGDAVLIEVVGDADSPYFVSAETLTRISGFPGPPSTDARKPS